MQFSKLPSLLLIPIFLLNTSCAGMNKKPAQPQDKPKKYVIQTTDQGKISVVGDTIMRRHDQLIVRTKEGLEHRFRLAEVKQVTGYDVQHGSHVWEGIALGTVAGGAGLGLAIGLNPSDCRNAGDPGDCRALKPLGTIIAAFIGAGVGALIGGGIGWAIPKRKKMTINPLLLKEENQTYVGGGLMLNF